MDAAKLVKMANQIAAAFAADPDHKTVLENTAGHLKRFWEPRMRRELLVLFDRGGDHGLSPVVAEALQLHRKLVEPAAK